MIILRPQTWFYTLEVIVNTDKMMVALDEFIHVSGGLILIIAAVSILTGLIREFVPQDKLQAKLTKHDKWGSLLGASFGMLTPFCSAAVVPVTLGMATMGTSLGTILSFLISAPLCNFIVLAMIYAAFGFKVTAIYLVLTFSAAVIGGWLISKSPWKNEVRRGDELELATNGKSCSSGCSSDNAALSHSTNSDKFKNVLKFALSLFKRIIPYVLLGALISGLSAAYLPAELVEKYVGGGDLKSIIIAALIGIPLYLRIEMAIPLLNVLILKGMGMGPALALIIGGTGASLPEIALVSSVLKRKAVLAFILIILTTAITGGVIFQYVI
ncbi:permease [Pseudoalteromonas sp. SWYJZ12]|nr:permease [Pseudoalteromonas sp. SWYJZ12]